MPVDLSAAWHQAGRTQGTLWIEGNGGLPVCSSEIPQAGFVPAGMGLGINGLFKQRRGRATKCKKSRRAPGLETPSGQRDGGMSALEKRNYNAENRARSGCKVFRRSFPLSRNWDGASCRGKRRVSIL
jgi:hypothetical protein